VAEQPVRRLHRDLLVVRLRDHGAPVWAAWNSSVGTQGRYSTPSCRSRARRRSAAPALGAGARHSSAEPDDEHRRPRKSASCGCRARPPSASPNSTASAARGARRPCRRAGERGRERAQQHHERVHPRLLAVLRDVRVAGGEHRREPGGAAAEHDPAPQNASGTGAARTSATACAWRARRCS
jgi:hypothetical protein